MSLVAVDASDEYEGQQQAEDAHNGLKSHSQALQGCRSGRRQRVGRCRQERQVSNCGREAHLKQRLGPPKVARLANAELHQARYGL